MSGGPHREGGGRKLRVLDCFAGIGGFSLGFERAGGFRTVGFVEIDPFCQRVLAKHWPDVPCHGDITTREFVEGEADVITGGFPCQDISFAGAGAGLAGARSGLYRELVRAIRLVRPRFAILENVAALLGRGLGTVLGDLAEIGQDAEWHCIPTGYPFGHERERVFVVTYPDGAGLARPGQPSPAMEQAGSAIAEELAASCFRRPQSAPDMVRNVHGIPDRAHRIAALGNAVVPQIPELIARSLTARAA